MTSNRIAIALILAVLLLFVFCVDANAQERRRPSDPTLAEQLHRSIFLVRTDLIPVGPAGADRYLWIFVEPNADIQSPLNDETVNGYTRLNAWRVRRVESTIGEPARNVFCHVLTLYVQSLDYPQRFKIDRNNLYAPLLDTDMIAFEWRPWWNISTSVDPDGVTCAVCGHYRQKMLARAGWGYVMPNAGCQ